MGRRKRSLALASAAVLAALAFGPAPARAQDAQSQAMGRALFNEGMTLFNQGNFTDACPKFEASLKHYPGIGTRGKLAECYEKLGKWASAWQLWRDVAQLATRAGEPTREQIASERAKALEPKLAYITVTIPPSNDAPGLVVKRNGQEIDRAKMGSAEPIDPGVIAFEVSAPGKKTFTGQVTVKEAQSTKFDVPQLESTTPSPPPTGTTATPPPSNGTSGGTTTYFPPAQEDSRPWQRPVGLVVASVGVVGLGVGSFFGLEARSTYDKPFNNGDCNKSSKQCDATGQGQVHDANTQATISTIFFVAGAALAAGGVVLILTAPTRTGLVVVPTTYASGGGLSASGRF
jgi:hypothetical protein